MVKSKPVLIIGTQRSGSNLLRIMLNQLREIDAPHPPHILQVFFPLIEMYGDLNDDVNFRTLINDLINFTEANPVKWQHVNFNTDRIFERCNKRSLIEIYKALYELKAEVKGANYWCCKSMANVHYVPVIENEMQPFYIHLIRDGRDVAASFQSAVVGEKHVYFIAKQWKKEQDLSFEIAKRYNGRTAVLYFEKFIDDPEKALTPILNKLHLKWNSSMLNFYKSEEAVITAAAGRMRKNVIRPVDSSNKKHFSEKLSKEEIEIFESVAGDTLLKFGYEINNEPGGRIFTKEEIDFFEQENQRQKSEIRKLLVDDIAVRQPQENVLAGIKSRFGFKTQPA